MQSFDRITSNSHPAADFIYLFLESLAQKNKEAFAKSFGRIDDRFFANLPGGVKVENIPQLISMHDDFFRSSVSRFDYGELSHGIGGDEFFICSVPAKVILPDASKRSVCIDMTFLKEGTAWVPRRLINTVVNSSDIAIKVDPIFPKNGKP